jgi:hypothetical protein
MRGLLETLSSDKREKMRMLKNLILKLAAYQTEVRPDLSAGLTGRNPSQSLPSRFIQDSGYAVELLRQLIHFC